MKPDLIFEKMTVERLIGLLWQRLRIRCLYHHEVYTVTDVDRATGVVSLFHPHRRVQIACGDGEFAAEEPTYDMCLSRRGWRYQAELRNGFVLCIEEWVMRDEVERLIGLRLPPHVVEETVMDPDHWQALLGEPGVRLEPLQMR